MRLPCAIQKNDLINRRKPMTQEAPALSPEARRAVTQERLRLLSLGYYISGAIGAVCVSFLLIHLAIFTTLSFIPQSKWNNNSKPATSVASDQRNTATNNRSDAPPVIIFRIAAAAVGCIILVGWILGGLTIYAGRCIKLRQRRTFVMIMAAINCIWIPHGTLLGIATFMTLDTPGTKEEWPC